MEVAGSRSTVRLTGQKVFKTLSVELWISYQIQPDPSYTPPDRRASHQPNLENQ